MAGEDTDDVRQRDADVGVVPDGAQEDLQALPVRVIAGRVFRPNVVGNGPVQDQDVALAGQVAFRQWHAILLGEGREPECGGWLSTFPTPLNLAATPGHNRGRSSPLSIG